MTVTKDTLQTENKMGVMPVNKLLISMALPMMISMLVQALYNIVDSMFVARVSENALTAVSLAFPMQNLMISVATGLGVGINALLSRSLGEGNTERANKTAMNGIFLTFVSYILFLIIGLTLLPIYMKGQSSIPEIIDGGIDYLWVCCIFSFGIFAQVTFERLLQATGRTFYAMITQSVGAVINIILDPILIFGYFGLPALGITGAAIATVIGQVCAALLAIIFNLTRNHELTLSIKKLVPEKFIIGQILGVGIPSIVMASIGSITTFCMNNLLGAYTSTAAAVFGVYFKLQSFALMPVFGLNNGMVPIIAYNYGARKKDRLVKTLKLSAIYAVVIMLICLLIMQCFPVQLLKLFDASDNMVVIGVPAIRIISLSFILAGYNIVCSSVFQSLGHGLQSMILSIARQLVVLLPVAYAFSFIGGLNVIWWSFPVAEIACFVIGTLFLLRTYNKIIKPL